MIIAAALTILAIADPTETLPIDRSMASFEAAIPELRQILSRAEEEVWRLGPPEPDWATSGVSAAVALAANDNDVDHVLGEWEEGGHGVVDPGDRPLSVPPGWHRYAVRRYDGPVDYHYYHRLTPGIVVHTFGAVTRIGNAECHRNPGIELIARHAWQSWPNETTLVVFGTVRALRDDTRTYCMMYRPAPDGRLGEVAYTVDGQPYLTVNENPQAFTVTERAAATTRIFSEGNPPANTAE
jgi:hypothetical protein